MNANPNYNAVRAPGHEHIPLYPRGFIAIRIVQLVLAVLILALSAYGVYVVALSSNVFIMVVALMTIITSIYHLVVRFNQPRGYNYWAVLALDIFLVVMWLCAFAVLAADVGLLYGYSYGYSYYSYSYSYGYGLGMIWVTCLAAAAGLGGLEFVLHIVSLVIHSVKLHKHRRAGLHCTPGAAQTLPVAMLAQAQEKPPGAPAGYSYPAQQPYGVQQPQPIYQQQQVPYGGVPQQHPQQPYPQQQQQQPQQPYYAAQSGQVPISTQPSGGSYQQQQQSPYYQQGAPVPLLAQTTGGSAVQTPEQQQPPQQAAPAQLHN